MLLILSILACNPEPKPDTSPPVESPPTDADGDGISPEAGDCDDDNPLISPAVPETCNGYDDDCDGSIDEGTTSPWYSDVDGDGHGDPATRMDTCEPPSGSVSLGDDCDDAQAFRYPGRDEACDGIDNDCDTEIDEEVQSTWYYDADADGFGGADATLVACEPEPGYLSDSSDCDDDDATRYPGNPEVCDGRDNDCNAAVDEGVLLTFYLDGDEDGVGGYLWQEGCTPSPGYTTSTDDCDDTNPEAYPGHPERCDGEDNDCDGATDEEDAVDPPTWYADGDADGFGDPATATIQCDAPLQSVADNTDCDDQRAASNPAALEYCNGFDDDCDGTTDEDDAVDALTWYIDTDADGYGDARRSIPACYLPAGYSADATDCNDAAANAFPGALESCDGVDNSCDGQIDENAVDSRTWYVDADGDGAGDPATALSDCNNPAGYVDNGADCNDQDRSAFPGAPENCDGVDNDCDGNADEAPAIDATPWYVDTDGDGYGDPATQLYACTAPASYVSNFTDCNDGESASFPGGTEVCDLLDNDCDGATDEQAVDRQTWYADLDGDGYAGSNYQTLACTAPSGYYATADDCDDLEPLSYPGASERCDGDDNNCDGVDDTLGYWPLDEGSGSVAGDSGPLGLDGTIVSPAWAAGHSGTALDLNGSSSYVDLPYTELVPTAGLSLSAWVQADSLSASSWNVVASVGSTGSSPLDCCRDTWALTYYRQQLWFYTEGSFSSYVASSSSYPSHVGSWKHLTATWDPSGTRRIFVDGILVATDNQGDSVLYSNGAPMRIGADTNNSQPTLYFDGRIDEVKLFGCAMSEQAAFRDYAVGWPF